MILLKTITFLSGKKAHFMLILAISAINVMSVISGPVIMTIKAQGMNTSYDQTIAKDLSVIQGNSLLAVSSPVLSSISYPSLAYKASESNDRMQVIITGYSSTVGQTDDTPFITASGATVRDGIVANNLLPIGTKVRIPALYGNKVFDVQDRMNWRMGSNRLDIWFPEYLEAKNFGVKNTYIEILESD